MYVRVSNILSVAIGDRDLFIRHIFSSIELVAEKTAEYEVVIHRGLYSECSQIMDEILKGLKQGEVVLDLRETIAKFPRWEILPASTRLAAVNAPGECANSQLNGSTIVVLHGLGTSLVTGRLLDGEQAGREAQFNSEHLMFV